MNRKIFKIVLIVFSSTIFFVVFILIFILTFSVYPKYILNANYGEIFKTGQKVSNKILSIIHFDKGISPIWKSENFSNPLKINQPFYYSLKSKDLPDRIFFNKDLNEYVYHSPMMPDPYTTFALLPGKFLSCENSIQQFRYKEFLVKKKSNELRIFITGGSTAWGALAPNNESTIGGFLEKKLRNCYPNKEIKVITAAAGAWNSTQERIWIFNRITEFEPDLIISYSGHNDVYDVFLKNENLFDYYWYDGEYYFNAILQYEAFNRGNKVKNKILDVRKKKKELCYEERPIKTIKNVKIINAYLANLNCKYIYVLQPIRKYERKDVEFYYMQIARELKKMNSESKNFLFVNHSELFDENEKFFYDRCHFGDKGNKLIAENLLNKIKTFDLFSN